MVRGMKKAWKSHFSGQDSIVEGLAFLVAHTFHMSTDYKLVQLEFS